MADQYPVKLEETGSTTRTRDSSNSEASVKFQHMIDKSSDRLRHYFDLLDGDPSPWGDLVFSLHLRLKPFTQVWVQVLIDG